MKRILKKAITYKSITWAIILLGVVLRVRQYLFGRSLWFDEAMLAINFAQKNFLELFSALEYYQAAPFGFLIVQKLLYSVFGSGELVLRFFPLISGIAAVILIWRTALMIGKGEFAVWSVLILSVSHVLVYYSNEVKQYSSDLMFSTTAIFLFLRLVSKPSTRNYLFSACAFSVMLWFSHPLILVIGPGILYIAYHNHIQRNQEKIKKILLLTIPVAISFLIFYYLNNRLLEENSYLQSYWKHKFPIIFTLDLDIWLQNLGLFTSMFRHPLGLHYATFAALVFILGLYACYKSDRSKLILIFLPILATYAVAAIERYPFGDRFLIFLATPVALIFSFAIEFIAGNKNLVRRILSFLVVTALLAKGLSTSVQYFIYPETKEELRDVLIDLNKKLDKEHGLYVYYGAIPAFQYYSNKKDIGRHENTYFGNNYRDKPGKYIPELHAFMKNQKNNWLIFSHNHLNERQLILKHLKARGQITDSITANGSSAILHSGNNFQDPPDFPIE